MTGPTPEQIAARDAQAAVIRRRRQVQRRQLLVFGVLVTALAVVGVGAVAVWTDNLGSPIHQVASTPAPAVVIAPPCPTGDMMPVEYGSIQLQVYNGTTITGLGSDVAKLLTARGFASAGDPKNSPTRDTKADPNTGIVSLTFGPNGINQAYTVAAQFDQAELVMDTRDSAVVDVEIGQKFVELVPVDSVPLQMGTPLTPVEGCTPYVAPDATADGGGDPAATEDPATDPNATPDPNAPAATDG